MLPTEVEFLKREEKERNRENEEEKKTECPEIK